MRDQKGNIKLPTGAYYMLPPSLQKKVGPDNTIDPKKITPQDVPQQYMKQLEEYGGKFSENKAEPALVEQSRQFALNNETTQSTDKELKDGQASAPTNNEAPNRIQMAELPSAQTTTDRDLAMSAEQSSEFAGGVTT
jgi:hypothetical protein